MSKNPAAGALLNSGSPVVIEPKFVSRHETDRSLMTYRVSAQFAGVERLDLTVTVRDAGDSIENRDHAVERAKYLARLFFMVRTDAAPEIG